MTAGPRLSSTLVYLQFHPGKRNSHATNNNPGEKPHSLMFSFLIYQKPSISDQIKHIYSKTSHLCAAETWYSKEALKGDNLWKESSHKPRALEKSLWGFDISSVFILKSSPNTLIFVDITEEGPINFEEDCQICIRLSMDYRKYMLLALYCQYFNVIIDNWKWLWNLVLKVTFYLL